MVFGILKNSYHKFRTGSIIYVIDPSGADILDISNFYQYLKNYNDQKKLNWYVDGLDLYAQEGEITFSGSIAPSRIKGAFYLGENGLIYYKNGNYKEH